MNFKQNLVQVLLMFLSIFVSEACARHEKSLLEIYMSVCSLSEKL